MKFINELNLVYTNLNNLKFDIFCGYDDCSKESHIVRRIVCDFLNENICIDDKHGYNHDDKKCLSLIDLLKCIICDIKKDTNCDRNYGYLLQLDNLDCILQNLEKLLCQLKCFSVKDCDLLAATLCALFEIIELIADIIAKINNMECLCKGYLCCKCEIEKCLLCLIVEEINDLEDRVSDLACLVLKIASLNIVNCTNCATESCHTYKERSYMKEYRYSSPCTCKSHTPKSTKYFNI